MEQQRSSVPTYEDLELALKLIGRRTPAALIRKDLLPELHKRGLLSLRPDRAFVVSELGKLVCQKVKDGEHATELE